MKPARPAIPWYGSKFNLASWIESHFPPHRVYVEPFGGAAGMMLQKAPSPIEIYNDIDRQVCNFFRVVRNAEQRARLIALLHATPYAYEEYHFCRDRSAGAVDHDPVEAARMFFVRAWQGFGGIGASTDLSNGWRRSVGKRRPKNEELARWLGAIPNLYEVSERLAHIQIEQDSAFDVIQRFDGPDTLFYVDPPYLVATRTSRKNYRSDFSVHDHKRLAFHLTRVQGAVVLSGYHSELYNRLYEGWTVREREAYTVGQAAAGVPRTRRVEVLWLNARATEATE